MKNLRIGLMICIVILIAIQLVLLFFTDLAGHERTGSIVSIVGLFMTITSLLIGVRNEKKQKTTDSSV